MKTYLQHDTIMLHILIEFKFLVILIFFYCFIFNFLSNVTLIFSIKRIDLFFFLAYVPSRITFNNLRIFIQLELGKFIPKKKLELRIRYILVLVQVDVHGLPN